MELTQGSEVKLVDKGAMRLVLRDFGGHPDTKEEIIQQWSGCNVFFHQKTAYNDGFIYEFRDKSGRSAVYLPKTAINDIISINPTEDDLWAELISGINYWFTGKSDVPAILVESLKKEFKISKSSPI